MPFTDEMSNVYNLGIRPACAAANADCERVDEQIFTKTILEKIYEQIERANIIVADVTGLRPNVLYELGYAHGLGKSVVLLTQSIDQVPFDLRPYPCLVYSKIPKLKSALQTSLSHILANPDEAATSTLRSKERRLRFEIMAKHIENYLKGKPFKYVSFERIRENLNSEYTDDLLLRMIDELPDRLRRVKMKGGKRGLGRVLG